MHTFKETCKILNITEHTLRYYTDNGLVPQPKRDARNRRVYSDEDLDWLRGAIYLRSLGFSINDIKIYHHYSLTYDISLLEKQLLIFKKQKEKALFDLQETKNKIKNIDKQIAYISSLIENKQIDYKSPANKKYKK